LGERLSRLGAQASSAQASNAIFREIIPSQRFRKGEMQS
jgi:hypothetical protein